MQAKREKPDPATFLGSGKIEELGILAKEAEVDVVVFDIALSAAQERNIERLIGIPVLDRTELILDIFRQRAKSREGRLQVELARLEHLSTRLVRGWTHLERQRGGLGKTGGPGEKQIELDRRMIGTRMKQLRDQLKRLARQRGTQRRARSRGDSITVSLAGYTNAGKSTLFNKITRAETYAADQLFATLDTTARKFWLSDEETVVATDTVGFIRGLPHQLIEAFKSTLDETVHADLILHVVDASSPVREEQIAEVNSVLADIHADDAVLLAADGADLGLNGQTVVMGQGDQLGGLGDVLVDGVVAAIEHDRGEAGGNAGLGTLIGAVIQMQGNGNGDAQALVHGLDHGSHGLEARHIFACALRDTEDDRGVHLLRSEQDALGPLQVVDVELTNCIVAIARFQQHIGSIYQHSSYLHVKRYQWLTYRGPVRHQAYYNLTLTKNQQVFSLRRMYFCHQGAKPAEFVANL